MTLAPGFHPHPCERAPHSEGRTEEAQSPGGGGLQRALLLPEALVCRPGPGGSPATVCTSSPAVGGLGGVAVEICGSTDRAGGVHAHCHPSQATAGGLVGGPRLPGTSHPRAAGLVAPPGEWVGGRAEPAQEEATLCFHSILRGQNSADTSLFKAAKSVGKTVVRECQEVNKQKIFLWIL